MLVAGTSALWRESSEKYLLYQTCHRRFQQWVRSGRLEQARKLLAALYEQGKLNLDEAFVNATFASAKKVGPTRHGKGTRIVAVADGNSLPLAISVQSASPAECRLMEEVLGGSFLDQLAVRLIGGKACDSGALDATLAEEHGIELIAPNRRGRKRITQNRRKLRCYRRR